MAPTPKSCRFYGRNGMFGRLLESGGNECALIRHAYSPCRMLMRGETPDESCCDLVRAHGGVEAALVRIAGGHLARVVHTPRAMKVARHIKSFLAEAWTAEQLAEFLDRAYPPVDVEGAAQRAANRWLGFVQPDWKREEVLTKIIREEFAGLVAPESPAKESGRTRLTTCPMCYGSKFIGDPPHTTCPKCLGWGEITTQEPEQGDK
jgi:hypothetical protein